MDVLVRLEDGRTDSPVLAHVNSLPVLPFGTSSRREIVTLYGAADSHVLALALAATVESERLEGRDRGVVRQLGVWLDRGAQGDSAWRNDAGQLVTQDLDIPYTTLERRAAELLGENGSTLRRVTAGLSMPDWPEGTARALSFSLTSTSGSTGGALLALDDAGAEHWLDAMRSADAFSFDTEDDAIGC